jgi:hypothetical protein
VVVALDRGAGAAPFGEHGAAVAAHVDERAELAGGIARREHRDPTCVGGQERAGGRDLLGPADVLP